MATDSLVCKQTKQKSSVLPPRTDLRGGVECNGKSLNPCHGLTVNGICKEEENATR
jgi:hypothetical protein